MSSAFGLKMSAENRENIQRSSKIPIEFLIIFPYFPPKKTFLSMAGFEQIPLHPPRGPAHEVKTLLHVSSLRMKTRNITKHTNDIHADRWDRLVIFSGFSRDVMVYYLVGGFKHGWIMFHIWDN